MKTKLVTLAGEWRITKDEENGDTAAYLQNCIDAATESLCALQHGGCS